MANDRNRSTREYASPNLYYFSPAIMHRAFEGQKFQMKPVMLAGQFKGSPGEDPHAHLKSLWKFAIHL